MGTDSDPGKQWMLRVKSGDEEAFRSLVEHYGDRVASFFRRSGADRATAEDLTQETFLRVYRARDRYRPTARFSTWMYHIVHRIAINEATRNRWRRRVALGSARGADREAAPAALPEPVEPPEASPVRELELGEVRAQVRDAVASLPQGQRTALLLNRFDGLSYAEIGEILGLGIPAVKSLLYRARENVRRTLQPFLQEEVIDEARG